MRALGYVRKASARDILVGTLFLLRNPRSWIKGAAARIGRRGSTVEPVSPAATCFCMTGAITSVSAALTGRGNSEAARVAQRRLVAVLEKRGKKGIVRFNDRIVRFNDSRKTKHADVIQVLTEAARSA